MEAGRDKPGDILASLSERLAEDTDPLAESLRHAHYLHNANNSGFDLK